MYPSATLGPTSFLALTLYGGAKLGPTVLFTLAKFRRLKRLKASKINSRLRLSDPRPIRRARRRSSVQKFGPDAGIAPGEDRTVGG